MPSEQKRGQEWRAWIYVVLWTLIIYAAIPFARTLQRFVADRWGREGFSNMVIATVLVGTASSVLILWRAHRRLNWSRALCLVAVAALYLYFTYTLRGNPEEALHFIEYGVLGLLCFRAFRHRIRDPMVYVCAALLCILIGTLDEVLQWAVPGRYFDFRDVRLNGLSGVLLQLAVALGWRPTGIRGVASGVGWRVACRLGIVQLLLLGACFSNTPERVEVYARHVPGLSFLSGNESAMNEFGYRHEIEGLGVFRSRRTLEELKAEDVDRHDEVAGLLDEFYDVRRYDAFLRTFPPGVDPFLHELRVHLHSRDHRLRAARDVPRGTPKQRAHLTAAYRENAFVEAFFGESVRRSRFQHDPAKNARLAKANLTDLPYESLVSAHLMTRNTEGQLWIMLGLGILTLAAIGRRAGALGGDKGE